ncbi:MAG: hypothetical protein ACLS9K_01200 [Lachnospira eligens]
MDIEYSIYDESGNEYSEEEAISTAGKYTVEYRFKDPKSGWIKNTAKLEIEVITEEFRNDIVVKNNTMSKDYNFRTESVVRIILDRKLNYGSCNKEG